MTRFGMRQQTTGTKRSNMSRPEDAESSAWVSELRDAVKAKTYRTDISTPPQSPLDDTNFTDDIVVTGVGNKS